jgi:thiol-disulfide isomerase/thioredoxin
MLKKWIKAATMGVSALLAGWFVMNLDAQNTNLQNLGAAPELHEGIWLNTDTPLKLENLRGQVVLLEMWTFDCYNCVNTLPYVTQWWETYQDEGLVVIGNHMPEFSYEADLNNLRYALTEYGVTYPVLQDNDQFTWDAYNNRYWPTIYLIDKQGNIRYQKIGEGAYEATERAIETLLAEDYIAPEATPESTTTTLWSLSATEIVNVRNSNSLQAIVIGLIQPNEAYYIRDEAQGWYKIEFDNQEAWVWGGLVTVNGSQPQ